MPNSNSGRNNGRVKPGELAPESRIYDCTVCGTPKAMLENDKAPRCEVCLETGRKQEWKPTRQELLIRTRNVKRQFEKHRTHSERISDAITGFCGTMHFVYIHAVWFVAWIVYNVLMPAPFDPYPFGFLTLVVSLEAIFLATFILISQNRQGTISDMRSELDYQVDLQAEKRTVELLTLLQDVHSVVMKKEEKKGKQ